MAFIMAVGTGVGMGGGVISSIARGAETGEGAARHGTTLTMLAVRRAHHGAAVHAGDAHLRALEPGRDAGATAAYTGVIAWGVPFQILVTGCTPLIRNQGKWPTRWPCRCSPLMNVALDYVFVILLAWAPPVRRRPPCLAGFGVSAGAGLFPKGEPHRRGRPRPDRHIALHALRLGWRRSG
ncbi:MAG: hypothetical protein ACLR3C_17385 [Eggerthella lenta]